MPIGYTRFGENVEKTFQSVDINSREELQAIADEEDRTINWELWDKLVTKTKQDIKEALQGFERVYTKPVFVYDIFKQKVIKTFRNPQECANYYCIPREQVHTYIRDHRVYYRLGIEFRQ